MYTLTTPNKRTEKLLRQIIDENHTTREKLRELQANPRTALAAHKLKGKLDGKWSCSLGYDLRTIYIIDDEHKEIIILGIGTHKIYK